MTRTPPRHVVRALKRYDPLLDVRWNAAIEQWDVTREAWATVYRREPNQELPATGVVVVCERRHQPEPVLAWPHWELTCAVLEKVRRLDGWRAARWRDFFEQEIRGPMQAPRLAKERALRNFQAEGRREMRRCLRRDLGQRVPVSLAGSSRPQQNN